MRAFESAYLSKIKYSSDQNFLKMVVNSKSPNSRSSTTDHSFKYNALKKITDQQYLYKFILTTNDSDLRHAAATHITDPELQKSVLSNILYDDYLLRLFYDSIVSDNELLFECLKKCTHRSTWKDFLLPKINSRKLLEAVKEHFSIQAKKPGNWEVVDIIKEMDKRIAAIPHSLDYIVSE